MPELPDALARRDLLYGKSADKADLAERYYAAGQRSDALDFWHRCGDEEKRRDGLKRLRNDAISFGSSFLLYRLHAVEPLDEKVWRDGLSSALSQERKHDALRIVRHLDDHEQIVKLETELGIRKPEVPEQTAEAAEGEATQAADGEQTAAAEQDPGEDAQSDS